MYDKLVAADMPLISVDLFWKLNTVYCISQFTVYLLPVKLFKKKDNAKITQIEDKMPGTDGLATTDALNVVESKIPNFRDLVKRIDYDAKMLGFENKYFTASEYSDCTGEIINAKIKEKGLVDK